MSAFWKDFRRSVLKNVGRFAALLIIAALGAGFYAGLRMTAPDMRLAADAYFDGTNMADLRVVSTTGFEDADIQRIAAIEGVEQVTPERQADVLAAVNGSGRDTFRVNELDADAAKASDTSSGFSADSNDAGYMNRPILVEGEWPDAPDECVVSDAAVLDKPVSIGDTITLSESTQDLDQVFSHKKFKVVGFVRSPYYVYTGSFGTTSLGNGEVDDYMYVTAGAFASDMPYTGAFVRVAGASALDCSADAYDDAVKTVQQRIEDEGGVLAAARVSDLKHQAQDELDKSWDRYRTQKAKADAKLAAAKRKLDRAKKKIDSGQKKLDASAAKLASSRTKLANGKKSYREGMQKLARQKSKAKRQLAQAQKTLDGKRAQLEKKSAALEKQAAKVEAQTAQLKKQTAALDEKERTLTEGEAQIRQQQAQLDAARAAAQAAGGATEEQQAAFAQAQAKIDAASAQAQAARTQIAQARAQMEEGAGKIAAAQAKIKAARAKIGSGSAQIQQAQRTLDAKRASANERIAAAQAKLDASAKKLDTAEKRIAAGQAKLHKASADLAQARGKYRDGSAAYRTQKQKARAKLAGAKRKLDAAQKKVDALKAPDIYVLNRHKNQGAESFLSDAERIDRIATVFPFVFFLVAALVALTTMTRMVEEDRQLIGTYKSLGYPNGVIAARYLLYALLASGAGCVLGIAVLSQFLPWFIMEAYGIVYEVPLRPTPIDAGIAALSAGLSIGIILAATAIASYSTLRETPALLMLPRAPEPGKRILLERAGFIWKRLSFLWKVTARNIFRYKRRFFMAVVGIAGCTALLLTGFGLHDSINDIIDKHYGPIAHYRTTVTYGDNQSAADRARAEKLLSNAAVYSSHTDVASRTLVGKAPAGGSTDGKEYRMTLMVPKDPQTFASQYLTLRERASQQPVALDDDSAVFAEKLADQLGVKPGDTVTLYETDAVGNAVGDGYQVKVGAVAEYYVTPPVIMTPAYYRQVFGEDPSYNTTLAVEAQDADSSEADRVTAALQNVPGVTTVSSVDDAIAYYRNALGSVNAVVVVLIVAAALLALVVMYNLTNINIGERVREIATLKVLGFTSREVSAYIFRETMIIAAIGALVGLVLGIYLEAFVVTTAEVDVVMFGRDIHALSFVLAFALSMAFAAVVSFAMKFKLDRIDMVESLKSVE
ncbi:MAG: FtsX-like permease family protein [Eggerthellaceae bacterium]|jgi:putative ABC transport system permease protein